jgi:hypothetical protein
VRTDSVELAWDLPTGPKIVAVDQLAMEPVQTVGRRNQVVACEIPHTCRYLHMKCAFHENTI